MPSPQPSQAPADTQTATSPALPSTMTAPWPTPCWSCRLHCPKGCLCLCHGDGGYQTPVTGSPVLAAPGPALPGLADLDAATEATATVLASPSDTTAGKLAAAEAEMAAFTAFWQTPGGPETLQAGI